MSRGVDYLNYVIDQLRNKIQEIDQTISDVQKDIAEMNEYYWENYTEMDQYGYENYDNQQALFSQVNASQEHQKRRSLWRKMLDSPFFGSVDFVYDGEEEAETFYIGIGNFARKRGSVPLIYDWRAVPDYFMIMTRERHPTRLRPGSSKGRSCQSGSIRSAAVRWSMNSRAI